MVVMVLGIVGFWQWGVARSNEKEAQANAQEARMQARIASSRLLLGQATELQESQPEVSLLLNAEALRKAPAPAKEEARFALLAKLTRPYHTSTPLTGHSDWVSDVDFSPDGKLLASASLDKTVRLWDAATGKQLGEPLTDPNGGVSDVDFSPDGKLLASTSSITVSLWDSEIEALITEACRIANRDLSKDEWSSFVGSEFDYVHTCSSLPAG